MPTEDCSIPAVSPSKALNSEVAGVVLDMDGTFYHQVWLRLIVGAWLGLFLLFRPKRVFREIRILRHYRRAQEWLRTNTSEEVTDGSQLERTAMTTGASLEEVRRCVNYWMEKLPLKFLPLCARRGLIRRVRTWHTMGIPIGIYSDYPVHDKLRVLGIEGMIANCICSTDREVRAYKPNPRGFTVTASKMGLPPERVYYIGDRKEVDGVGAERAGMRPVILGQDSGREQLTMRQLHGLLSASYGKVNGTRIGDYISIARPDHWFKNFFMLPGMLIGWIASGQPASSILVSVLLGIVATCLVASSNYTINEWLDAEEDRKHPEKRTRPAAAGRIRRSWAYIQWIVLAFAGLFLGWAVNIPFFVVELSLFVMGIVYNFKPMRTKDIAYLDVLSESINNPLRLLLGWYAVGCFLIPPVSLLLSYWMMGAFFMAIKRFAEINHINDAAVAAAYRRPFLHYTAETLIISIVFYVAAFGIFTGMFIIRYRIELIIAVPFFAGFMAIYMHLGFLPNSPARNPEALYKNRFFLVYSFLTACICIICLVIRLPWLPRIFEATIPSGG